MGCRPGRCHLRNWAADVSDLHGLKHIAGKGNLFRRLIWVALFLLSLGYCAYEIYLVADAYISYNHITQVDVEYVTEVEFPAVTICNFNKYRESAWTEDDLINVGTHLGIIDENNDLIFPELYTQEFQDFVSGVDWTGVEEDEDYNMTDFTLRTGHQREDLIISCTWQEEACEEEDIVQQMTHMGNCFTYNLQEGVTDETLWKHAYSAGSANGLQLVLDLELEEYTPSNDLDGGAMDAGIRIMLHYPSEPPYPKELGFSVSAGVHSFVTMQHEKITSLPLPYTDCENDGGEIITHFDHYSLQACRIECETLVVVAECGCRLPEMPGEEDVCGPAELHECAHPTLVQFTIGNLTTAEPCDCDSPCEIENYPYSISAVNLRANFMEQLYSGTSRNMSADYIRENVAVVTIYYDQLNYATITMIPEFTFPTLLAVLGGNLGLFLGASFLTIAQLGEYFMDEVVGWCVCAGDRSGKKEPEDRNKVAPALPDGAKDAWSDEKV